MAVEITPLWAMEDREAVADAYFEELLFEDPKKAIEILRFTSLEKRTGFCDRAFAAEIRRRHSLTEVLNTVWQCLPEADKPIKWQEYNVLAGNRYLENDAVRDALRCFQEAGEYGPIVEAFLSNVTSGKWQEALEIRRTFLPADFPQADIGGALRLMRHYYLSRGDILTALEISTFEGKEMGHDNLTRGFNAVFSSDDKVSKICHYLAIFEMAPDLAKNLGKPFEPVMDCKLPRIGYRFISLCSKRRAKGFLERVIEVYHQEPFVKKHVEIAVRAASLLDKLN